jgi:peptidoglycan/LPS O-acetylase OafA/YrhL
VRLFSFLGGVSYALYAIHAASIPLFRVAALRYFKESPPILISLTEVAVLVVISYLLDVISDQPVRRALTAYFRHHVSVRARYPGSGERGSGGRVDRD